MPIHRINSNWGMEQARPALRRSGAPARAFGPRTRVRSQHTFFDRSSFVLIHSKAVYTALYPSQQPYSLSYQPNLPFGCLSYSWRPSRTRSSRYVLSTVSFWGTLFDRPHRPLFFDRPCFLDRTCPTNPILSKVTDSERSHQQIGDCQFCRKYSYC